MDKAIKLAEQLYNECQTVKPTWQQLSPLGATQSVWIERARAILDKSGV